MRSLGRASLNMAVFIKMRGVWIQTLGEKVRMKAESGDASTSQGT